MGRRVRQPMAPADDLGAPEIPIGALLSQALEIAYTARRAALLEGPTGIGKSAIVGQLAQRLGIGFRVVDLSLLEPPDLIGLPTVADGRTRYAIPALLPTEGCGILMFEELNRCERYVQQPCLQLLTARRLNDYVLPDGWSMIAAINPEGDEYQVSPMDPALRSRFLCLKVRADRANWLTWAKAGHVHPAVLALVGDQSDALEAAPPRSWTYASDILWALDRAGRLGDNDLSRTALSGYLPLPLCTALLRRYLPNEIPGIGVDARTLLARYHELGGTLRGALESGRTDLVKEIVASLRTLMDSPEIAQLAAEQDAAQVLSNFDALTADLPGDHRETLLDAFARSRYVPCLLPVRALDVCRGFYRDNPVYREVSAWAKAKQFHRIGSLGTDLVLLMENRGHFDGQLAGDRACIVRSLGEFIRLIGTLKATVGGPILAPIREAAAPYDILPREGGPGHEPR